MTLIRIILLGCDTLLSDGLFSFLQQASDLEVQALSGADTNAILLSIAQARPSVVILNVAGQHDPLQLITALFDLQDKMSVCVFGVRTDNSNLVVYSKADMVLAKGEQLLELIREAASRLAGVPTSPWDIRTPNHAIEQNRASLAG
jgi:DNA-binding NarL/FixJ family response regulator